MKITLIIPDHLMRALKCRAAQKRSPDLTSLPVHRLGRPRVNIADRDALDRAMEGN
jgi:hypothetical protein